MELQYAIALLISTIVSIVVANIAWQRRSAVGGTSLFIVMTAAVVWSFTYAIRWLVTYEWAQNFWLDATYFGVVVAPTAILVLALEYTGRIHMLTTRIKLALSIIPVLTIIILWTDPWHGLFYDSKRTGEAILNGGVWFWIFIIYTYLTMIIASFLMIQKIIRDKQFFQIQASLLLAGFILPWFGNIVSMLGVSPFPGLDMTPFLFSVSGICFMFGLFRFGLFDIVPIARSSLMENLQDGVLVIDKENRIVDLNPAAQKILEIPAGVIGKSVQEISEEYPKLQLVKETADSSRSVIVITSDKDREYDMNTLALTDRLNKLEGKIITLHDVTEYKEVEEKIRRSEEHYRLLFENAVETIVVLQNRLIVFCNPGATELTGYSKEELLNQSFVPLIYPDDLDFVLENYARRVRGEIIKERYQFRLIRKDSSIRWVENSGIRIDWEGEIATLHFIMDITNRKQAEAELEFRSTHDVLTGLFNREFFEMEISRLKNSRRQPISILVLDMNGLKDTNDNYGHAAGDEQLRMAAEVIRRAFRPEDVIARIGGDEFVVLLPETNWQTAESAINRIKHIMKDHNQSNPDRQLLSFSIGYATTDQSTDLQEVFRLADRNMYANKAAYYTKR